MRCNNNGGTKIRTMNNLNKLLSFLPLLFTFVVVAGQKTIARSPGE